MSGIMIGKRRFKGKDMTGKKFGRITVIGFNSLKITPGAKTYLWDCRCVCGKEVIVRYGDLVSCRTRSCGCLQRESTIARFTRHGFAPQSGSHPFYLCWRNIIARCLYPNNVSYPWYGARGN